MTLTDYVTVVMRRWPAVLAFAIIGIVLAGIFSLTAPKEYTATTQNFVALTGSANDDSNALNGAQFAAQRVKSYTEIVTSPDVLQPVISELNLPDSTEQLAAKVSAVNPPLTVLLMVSANYGNATQSAQIANAVSLQMGRVIEKLETPNAQSVAPVKVTLTDPATPPSAPSSPKTRINLVLGLILGLFAGLAWAFARNALDRSVKSQVELDKLVAAPSVGAVTFDANAATQSLSALDTTAAVSEGYRTIRTNMQFVDVDNPVRAFVVTSAAPGDGKTTIACNLAITLAQAGKRVCLVESDLRRPRVAEYLDLAAGAGLTEVLAGQVSLEDALQGWGRGMLHVLPPGSIPPNPSEILGSHQMAQVIAKLKESFDMVILDTPPLLAVSDAAVLATQVDGAIVVVRYGTSTRDAVRNAVSALEHVNAKILGTVLNAVPAKRGYGYGYGYTNDQTKAAAKPESSQPGATTDKSDASTA